jgi:hypothetical protein
MGAMTAALVGLTAMSATSQYMTGQVQQAEAEYNARIAEEEAKMVDLQADIDYGRYQRLKGKTMAQSKAAVAGMGIEFTGSPISVIVAAQKQIGIDQIVSQFDFTTKRNALATQAAQERRRGKMAAYAGMTNAFSTMLSGASQVAMYKAGMPGSKPTTKSVRTSHGINIPSSSINTRYNRYS